MSIRRSSLQRFPTRIECFEVVVQRSQAFYCGSDLLTRPAIKIPIAHQTMQRRLFCFQGLDFFRQCLQFAPFFVGEFAMLIVSLFRNCSPNRRWHSNFWTFFWERCHALEFPILVPSRILSYFTFSLKTQRARHNVIEKGAVMTH